MIIEMVGSPGSGKTYLSNDIVKSLIDKDKFAINVIDKQRNKFIIKVLWKLYRNFIKFNVSYKKELKRVKNIFREYQYKESEFINVDINYYFERLVFLKYLYRKLNVSSNVYIFDEGILQILCSMSVYFNIDLKLYKDDLKHIIPDDIVFIYVDASKNTILQSIENRNRHVCAMDELNGQTLIEFLDRYIYSCEALTKFVSCCKVHRSSKLEKNVTSVIEYINTKNNFKI